MSLDLTGEAFADDRIRCLDCRELRRNGDCLAARERRRLDVSEYYGHGATDVPWRCEFFVAKPDAADQRSGAERYPDLYAEYETKQAERNGGYADRWPTQFTIRSARDTGARTELAKIVDGFGDWMFYGHAADDATPALARWMLLDLHAWRAHLIREGQKTGPYVERRIRREMRSNGDGTHFAAFDAKSFLGEPPLIVACSHPEDMRERISGAPEDDLFGLANIEPAEFDTRLWHGPRTQP